MPKPGVMFYFDIRPCIKRLEAEDCGKLFEAILDYGEFGILPEFEGILGVAWDFIQPKLDRDTAHYNIKVEKSQYAVYSRECKKNGTVALAFEDWKQFQIANPNQTMSVDDESYPESPLASDANLHTKRFPAALAEKRKDTILNNGKTGFEQVYRFGIEI